MIKLCTKSIACKTSKATSFVWMLILQFQKINFLILCSGGGGGGRQYAQGGTGKKLFVIYDHIPL